MRTAGPQKSIWADKLCYGCKCGPYARGALWGREGEGALAPLSLGGSGGPPPENFENWKVKDAIWCILRLKFHTLRKLIRDKNEPKIEKFSVIYEIIMTEENLQITSICLVLV